MAKKAVVGEEYKVLKQKSTPKRIAKFLIFIWFAFIIAHALYLTATQSEKLKEYIVVKAVYSVNDVLKTQYETLTNNILDTVNINQYTSKIEVPEINLTQFNEAADKTRKAAATLAKLGIKEAAKIEDTTADLQKKFNNVNAQLQSSANKVRETLQSDITAALKKELSGFADEQVQKQLGINATVYQNLVSEKFGLFSMEKQKVTHDIYTALTESPKSFLSGTLSLLNTYFQYFVWGMMGLIILFAFVPAVIVWWIAKKLSDNFTECPYCHKIFLSKKAKFNLLKLFKS